MLIEILCDFSPIKDSIILIKGGNIIKRKLFLKISAILLIIFMSLSVVSTAELSDSDSSSSDSDSISLDLGDDDSDIADESGDDSPDSSSADEPQSDASDDSSSDAPASDDSSSGGSSSDTPASDDSSKESDSSSSDSSGCNITISKIGDKKVKVGEVVTWNITVNNTENDAKNVVVKEKMPKNFEFVSAKASKGTFDEKTSNWKIGDMKKTESASLTIKAKAKKAGNYTNQAEILTDSNNINKNKTVQADLEVVSEDKSAAVKKTDDKKSKEVKKVKDKVKKIKDKVKSNQTKANQTKNNNTNQTNKKADLKHAGNPIMVIILSIFTVLGLGVLKRK